MGNGACTKRSQELLPTLEYLVALSVLGEIDAEFNSDGNRCGSPHAAIYYMCALWGVKIKIYSGKAHTEEKRAGDEYQNVSV